MSLNVNSSITDAFYRYKMPGLRTKMEGKGNGIKTVICNMDEVGKALARPPVYPTKFFGIELGAQTQVDTKNDKYIINGAHEAKNLQELLDKFIKKYVLCPNCENPETVLEIVRSQVILGKCKACGWLGEMDSNSRMATFIVKNPPEMFGYEQGGKLATKSGGTAKRGDKKSRQAAKAERQKSTNTAAVGSGQITTGGGVGTNGTTTTLSTTAAAPQSSKKTSRTFSSMLTASRSGNSSLTDLTNFTSTSITSCTLVNNNSLQKKKVSTSTSKTLSTDNICGSVISKRKGNSKKEKNSNREDDSQDDEDDDVHWSVDTSEEAVKARRDVVEASLSETTRELTSNTYKCLVTGLDLGKETLSFTARLSTVYDSLAAKVRRQLRLSLDNGGVVTKSDDECSESETLFYDGSGEDENNTGKVDEIRMELLDSNTRMGFFALGVEACNILMQQHMTKRTAEINSLNDDDEIIEELVDDVRESAEAQVSATLFSMAEFLHLYSKGTGVYKKLIPYIFENIAHIDEGFAKKISTYKSAFAAFCDNEGTHLVSIDERRENQRILLGCIEKLVTEVHPKLVRTTGFIMAAFFNADLITKRLLLEWKDGKSGVYLSPDRFYELITIAKAFFYRLENYSDDEDDEDCVGGGGGGALTEEDNSLSGDKAVSSPSSSKLHDNDNNNNDSENENENDETDTAKVSLLTKREPIGGVGANLTINLDDSDESDVDIDDI